MTIDRTYIGISMGAVLPLLTSLLFYKYGYGGDFDYFDFLSGMMRIRGTAMLIAVCCLPNLALFSVFVNIEKLKISRGIFLSTLVYAFAIIVLKFII